MLEESVDGLKRPMSSVFCFLSRSLAGKRFEYDDHNLPYFKKLLTDFIILSGVSDFLFMPKFIIQMGFRKSLRQRRKEVSLALVDYMEKEIEEHRRTLIPSSERDFLDSYLVEMAKQQKHVPEPWNRTLSGMEFQTGSRQIT